MGKRSRGAGFVEPGVSPDAVLSHGVCWEQGWSRSEHGWGKDCWSRSRKGGQETGEDLKMLFAGPLCCRANSCSLPSLGTGTVGIAAAWSQPQDAWPRVVSPFHPCGTTARGCPLAAVC